MIHNMPWLKSIFDHTADQMKSNRFAHALLVCGEQGIGIDEFAEDVARHRICSTPADRGCRDCKSCQLLVAGNHPDMMRVVPTGAANEVKVDQIREVVAFLAQTPQIADWKVVLIAQAHRMNTNAANALLKVLEEPQGNTLLLLVSDRPQLLLPTVRSRCQKKSVRSPSQQQTKDFCLAQGVSEEDIVYLSDILGAKPTLICEWVSEGCKDQWALLQRGLDEVSSHKTTKELTDSLADLKLTDILQWLSIRLFREVKLTDNNRQRIKWLDMHRWLMSAIIEVERGGNPNRQLLLDECFLRWKGAKVSD